MKLKTFCCAMVCSLILPSLFANGLNSAALFIPQPFSIHYERFDYHVMVYFEGHPEYEAVEAFICETPVLEIRAIITRHDQSQVDYFNREDFTGLRKGDGVDRERHVAAMTYTRGGTKNAATVSLAFETVKGEPLEFFLVATSAPMSKYGGLVDPGRHSIDSSLPVIFRKGSSLAGEESFISFVDTRYKIPLLVDASPHFKGYKGYYSEAMRIAVFRAADLRVEFLSVPESYAAGEKWVFTENGITREWTITERNGSSMYVSGPDQVLRFVVDGERVGLLSIVCTNDDPGMTFQVDFASPVCVSGGKEPHRSATTFSLGISGNKNVVTGSVSLESDAERIRITLAPRSPSWSVTRVVRTTITKEDSALVRETRIIEKE